MDDTNLIERQSLAIARLTKERDDAEAKAMILGIQLGGWEAEAAAMYHAIERVLDTCPLCRVGTCGADTHRWLREAIAPSAGTHLLELLAEVAEELDAATQPTPHPLRHVAERLARFRRPANAVER